MKNAAWDITYLSDFIKKVNEVDGNGTRYILASSGKALHIMAKFLFDFGAEGIHLDPMANGLLAWWPVDQAVSIAERFARLIEEVDAPIWALKNQQPDGFIDDMIARAKQIVLSDRAHPARC